MTKKCVLSAADPKSRTLTLDGKAYRSKAFVQDWADYLKTAKCDIPVVVWFAEFGELKVVVKVDFDLTATNAVEVA